MGKYSAHIDFIRELFETSDFIPLHVPTLGQPEKDILDDVINSTMVSSVGPYVDQFEQDFASFHGVGGAVACVNGTAALHLCLLIAGVGHDTEVLTQSLSFVATGNAISYTGAKPVFIDVDRGRASMCPDALARWLDENADQVGDDCINKNTGARISAVVPMHTFGLPCDIVRLQDVCTKWNIPLVEDAAESLGSMVGDKACGTFGVTSASSFNGNKTITTGGGGMILAANPDDLERAKFLSTTAKQPHRWEYFHAEIGYNYRLPNINAALGVSQLRQLPSFLANKRELAAQYRAFFSNNAEAYIDEPSGTTANFWLNAILLNDRNERDLFLCETNDAGVMTRPVWEPLHTLPMFKGCQRDSLENTTWLTDRIVNIPSSVRQS